MLNLPIEHTIRRGDDTNVDGNRVTPADPIHLTLLQDAQQFRLEGQIHFADFVQQEGAGVSHLELPDFPDDGTGKGTSLMTEEFTFQ